MIQLPKQYVKITLKFLTVYSNGEERHQPVYCNDMPRNDGVCHKFLRRLKCFETATRRFRYAIGGGMFSSASGYLIVFDYFSD